ncbi:MAG: hypothetical protein WBV82_16035 [Myxococcaceae bacterium]
MNRSDLILLAVVLGRVFMRLGMKGHAHTLRLYFLALRHGLTQGQRHVVKVDWSEDAVLEWLKVLRVPPYQDAYPVRRRGSGCDRCAPGSGHPVEISTLLTFAGGAKMGCRTCGRAWLELEDARVTPGQPADGGSGGTQDATYSRR